MEKEVNFRLNLNPRMNRYMQKWGLLGNPFDGRTEDMHYSILANLKNGVSKKDARFFMKRAGVTREAVTLILSKLECGDIADISLNIPEHTVQIRKIEDVKMYALL